MIQRGPTTLQMGHWRLNPSGRRAFWSHTASLLLAVLYINTCIVEAPCLVPKCPASRPHLILLEALCKIPGDRRLRHNRPILNSLCLRIFSSPYRRQNKTDSHFGAIIIKSTGSPLFGSPHIGV